MFFGQKNDSLNLKICQNCYGEDRAGLFTVLESYGFVLSNELLMNQIGPKVNFI